jgi:LacI family transcriptional regulator
MKTLGKARIHDVARLAGVSIATVSRALTIPSRVHPETLERVQDAVTKLDYVAHGHARALASRRSNTVGAVIPSLENAIWANTAFALQKVLGENGYMLVVACSEYDLAVETRHVRGLIGRGVDGLVLTQVLHEPELHTLLERFRIPHVFTWAYDSSGRLPAIGFDHRRATSQITRYLLDLGHREFGVISTTTHDNKNAQDRLAGVLETLESAGIKAPADWIREAPFSYAKGREAFRAIASGGALPTVVVCLNDVLAIGAMAEARAMGIKVPDDISITGCEDLEVAAAVTPALTTVRYPTWEMGHFAGVHLLARLGGEIPQGPREFPTELVVRESAAPPRRKTTR